MDKMRNLKDLYVHELKDLYDAESKLIEALPKMKAAASDETLKKAFDDHLQTTKQQKKRLEKIFESLDEEPTGVTCKAMAGLVAEGEEIIKSDQMEKEVRDAGLIAAAQRVEHYEMAGYGTARTFAKRLGRDEDCDLLQATLDEEAKTDQRLTQLAESNINPKAEK